jgi:hypothetical protein
MVEERIQIILIESTIHTKIKRVERAGEGETVAGE